MKILALDTTANTATTALLEADGEHIKTLASYSMQTSTHSTVLLPMIESVFERQGIEAENIDLYVSSVGPGSFTGVRIGVSTVKGLAFPKNTPAVGVSSLEAMAENFAGIDAIVIPVIDARRAMVYTAVFRTNKAGIVERLAEDMQISIDETVKLACEYGKDAAAVYFTGDAYEKLISSENLPENAALTPLPLRNQSAVGVAMAGLKKWNETENRQELTEAALVPVYLKKSQAEREREERISAEANE